MIHETFIAEGTGAMFYNDAVVAAFVEAMLEAEPFKPGYKAIGFCDANGLLEAGVVYTNWQPQYRTLELCAAAKQDQFGTVERLRLIMAYPFEVCQCRFLVARTSSLNPRPLRIWKALGAKFYRIDDLRGDGEDEIVTTLSAAQWFGSKFYG